MSDKFYGLNIGHQFDPRVVETDVSTTGKTVELRLSDGAGLNRMSVLLALKTLEAFFERNGSY